MLGALPVSLGLLLVSVGEVPNPRARGSWVSDLAGILGAEAEARLDERLTRLERDRGVELAVVTALDVEGTPKAFATALFNAWGVGKAGEDNGVLVLVVTEQRRIEIEVGDGLAETLSQKWIEGMLAEEVVPRFKARDYEGGVEACVDALETKLRGGLWSSLREWPWGATLAGGVVGVVAVLGGSELAWLAVLLGFVFFIGAMVVGSLLLIKRGGQEWPWRRYLRYLLPFLAGVFALMGAGVLLLFLPMMLALGGGGSGGSGGSRGYRYHSSHHSSSPESSSGGDSSGGSSFGGGHSSGGGGGASW